MFRRLIVVAGMLIATFCVTLDTTPAEAGRWHGGYGWRSGGRGGWGGYYGYRAWRPRYYHGGYYQPYYSGGYYYGPRAGVYYYYY